MKQEFVSYEQAVALKELGFEDDCMGMWAIQYPLKDFDTGAIVQRINEVKIPHPVVSKFDVDLENNISKDGAYYALAPLKQQAFRWFREKYGLLGYVDSDTQEYGIEYSYHVNILKEGDTWFKLYIDTYEKAENACIEELITLAKQQDK